MSTRLPIVPADLSRWCWKTIPENVTPQEYKQFLNDAIWHQHSIGGRLYLDVWIEQHRA
jgi:hypothetical protein